MAKVKDIGEISRTAFGVAAKPLESMREAIQTLLGLRGDPLDRAITFRLALERGLIDRLGNALGGGGITYVNTYLPGGGGGGGGGAEYVPDLTPPPTVTGLSIIAGFTQVLIQVDAPIYTQGHGNLQTNIYAVKKAANDPTLPTFEPGVTPLVYAMPGTLNIASIPSELNTRWHVWAKYQSLDGVESTDPAGGVNGESDTTGQDIAQLLEVLTGAITESQLYAALGERINLIDGGPALPGSVNARMLAEANARITGLLAEATVRGAAITSEATTRQSADDSMASSITTLTAAVGVNAAAVSTEQTARANADTALAGSISTVVATAAGNTAAISTEQLARADGDNALATTISLLSASVGGFNAAITTEQTVRAAADGAAATRIDSIRASGPSGTVTADPAILGGSETWVFSNPIYVDWVAGSSTNRRAWRVSGAAAHVTGRVFVPISTTKRYRVAGRLRSSADASTDRVAYLAVRLLYADGEEIGGDGTFWFYPYSGVHPATSWVEASGVFGAGTARPFPAGAASMQVAALLMYDSSVLSPVSGWMEAEYLRIEDDEAARVSGEFSAAILSEQTARVEDFGALSTSLGLISAAAGDNTAAIAIEQTARANGDGANATSIDILSATVGDNTAAIATEQFVRANQTGLLYAQYTVKLDVGGYVSGFGQANDGATSSFIVRADRFVIGPPAAADMDGQNILPFIVQATPQTINGVLIPAGVYMDAAYIVNLSAMYARFGTLIADSIAVGQISAANLTLGSGTVGGDLKSSGFTYGSGAVPGTGWLLTPGGNLYASNAVIYGTIYAMNGVFGGALSAATGTFSGALSAATGSFAGDISAATGTFSGGLNINSGGSSRMEITDSRIKVFNLGVERIRFGDLS